MAVLTMEEETERGVRGKHYADLGFWSESSSNDLIPSIGTVEAMGVQSKWFPLRASHPGLRSSSS